MSVLIKRALLFEVYLYIYIYIHMYMSSSFLEALMWHKLRVTSHQVGILALGAAVLAGRAARSTLSYELRSSSIFKSLRKKTAINPKLYFRQF